METPETCQIPRLLHRASSPPLLVVICASQRRSRQLQVEQQTVDWHRSDKIQLFSHQSRRLQHLVRSRHLSVRLGLQPAPLATQLTALVHWSHPPFRPSNFTANGHSLLQHRDSIYIVASCLRVTTGRRATVDLPYCGLLPGASPGSTTLLAHGCGHRPSHSLCSHDLSPVSASGIEPSLGLHNQA
ncbi:hypothetical protein MN608_02856 [Microdochium nivale]|nr:hypothetical protein MN608_02856 [Microdochium nivale]